MPPVGGRRGERGGPDAAGELTSADGLHPSGGYLWGYPVAALVVGFLCERYGRGIFVTVPAMLLGSVVLYAIGLVWLHAAVPSS